MMPTQSRFQAIGLVALLLICFTGCSSGRSHSFAGGRRNHAIFNPFNSPVALADFDRADWPMAYSGGSATEETQYREHFVDIHGRGHGRDDGFLFRRFESDRFGRSRR